MKKYSIILTQWIAQRSVLHIDLPFEEATEIAESYDGGDIYDSFTVVETTDRDRKEYKERVKNEVFKHQDLESYYDAHCG